MQKTFYKGVTYDHKDYTTATKQKTLPEPVKKAIQGDKYVEHTVIEQPAETPQEVTTQE